MTEAFPLAHDFPTPEFADWAALASNALKGAALERLSATTYDGVEIKPFYRAMDLSSGLVGTPAPPRDAFLPWDIRQIVRDTDPVTANSIALYDMERGVSSIEFCLDPTGAQGVAATTKMDFERLTKGIITDLATIALEARFDPLQSAALLRLAINPAACATAKLAFNLDPMGQIMGGGPELSLADAAAFAQQTAIDFTAATALRADARPIHEGGGSECQELAVLIASGLAFLKAGEGVGMSPEQVNATLLFTMSAGPDVVLEIAKLKAARRLWGRVLAACGSGGAMQLQAVTSARMQSIADPWTNIIRVTCATFAAGVGGADIVTSLPFSSAYAHADGQARRIARNTQLILQEESYLGRVADPSAGAYAMEAIADGFATTAWALVQEIERTGGLEAALRNGLVQGWVRDTRAKREKDVARRKSALVGVSVFPNLAQTLATPGDAQALVASAPTLSPSQKGEELAIAPMRLSAPFEALRYKDQKSIFLATIGPLSKFAARAGFAKNAFEAGGIKAIGGEAVYTDDAAIIAAFSNSGARIVCICGDDAHYETHVVHLASALKSAGAVGVWLAGKAAFDNVDRHLFAGADILAELTFAHHILEGAA